MVEHIVHIAQSERFEEHIAYLPDYKMETAEVLVQGSDVWLNTPVEGLEACGTSGMKAGLNGVLQCSTNDGWVWEVDWKDVGWLLDDQNISESIYKTLQNEIVPLFAKRDDRGMPIQWLNRMIKTAQIIRNQFSSKRMLEEYQEKLYK
jgi:starch phosphorylase